MIDVGEIVGSFEIRFWWLRGAAAAIGVTEIVEYFDVERVTWLTGMHLILAAWSEVCGLIGALVGRIPFLPELSSETVNTAIFTGFIGLPATVAFAQDSSWPTSQEFRTMAARKEKIGKVLIRLAEPLVAVFCALGVLVSAIVAYHELITYDFNPKVREEWTYPIIELPGVTDAEGNPIKFPIRQKVVITRTTYPLGAYIGLASIGILYIYSLYLFQKMWRAFVYVIGFFACSEILFARGRRQNM